MSAAIFKGQIVTLRPITEDDAEITLSWRLSPRAELMQIGAQTVEEQKSWIKSKIPSDEINCIIEYKNRPVGMIALLEINQRHNRLEMGRLLIGEKEFVGNAPVVFESELMLCDYAFDSLGMHKICGDVVEDNHGVLKMRQYLGYKQDGFLRDNLNYHGVYKGVYTLSLLEQEYRAICRPKLIQLIELMSKYN